MSFQNNTLLSPWFFWWFVDLRIWKYAAFWLKLAQHLNTWRRAWLQWLALFQKAEENMFVKILRSSTKSRELRFSNQDWWGLTVFTCPFQEGHTGATEDGAGLTKGRHLRGGQVFWRRTFLRLIIRSNTKYFRYCQEQGCFRCFFLCVLYFSSINTMRDNWNEISEASWWHSFSSWFCRDEWMAT